MEHRRGRCLVCSRRRLPKLHLYALGNGRGVVGLMTAVSVVGMGMGDEGSINRLPRIDVEVACFAVETFGANGDEGLGVAGGG